MRNLLSLALILITSACSADHGTLLITGPSDTIENIRDDIFDTAVFDTAVFDTAVFDTAYVEVEVGDGLPIVSIHNGPSYTSIITILEGDPNGHVYTFHSSGVDNTQLDWILDDVGNCIDVACDLDVVPRWWQNSQSTGRLRNSKGDCVAFGVEPSIIFPNCTPIELTPLY